MVKLSKRFIWVMVDRDVTPEIPRRLNVSAYPSLLTLGREEENIYRFSSYQEADAFTVQLKTALERYALYVDGKRWHLPETRPDAIAKTDQPIKLLPAPSDVVPGGMTRSDQHLWVAQQKLYQLDAATGRIAKQSALPASVADLCSDGKRLYAVTFGWTAGKPIYVIDPADGSVEREIVTKANLKNRAHGAKGIAWRDGKLYVLEGMRGLLQQVNPETGDIEQTMKTGQTWLAGLAYDGQHFVAGSREFLIWLDAESGRLVKQMPVNYRLRSVAADREHVYLMEQPEFGFGPRHERIQVWPQQTVIYRLGQ